MFIGTFYHNLDAKNRVKIPSKLLDKARDPEKKAATFYITKGMEGCLFLFTEERWMQLAENFHNLSLGAVQAREFQRLFFANAFEVNVDGSGRILIPEGLKKTAKITREVVLLGAGNRIEVWDAKTWDSHNDEIDGGFEEIAAAIL